MTFLSHKLLRRNSWDYPSLLFFTHTPYPIYQKILLTLPSEQSGNTFSLPEPVIPWSNSLLPLDWIITMAWNWLLTMQVSPLEPLLNPATKMILLNSNSGTESFVQALQYFPSHFELGTSLQRGQSELP